MGTLPPFPPPPLFLSAMTFQLLTICSLTLSPRDCVLRRWFCHFDDDNYVNIPRLLSTLGKYSAQEDWYLGKPSIRTPLEILDREKKYAAKRVRKVVLTNSEKSFVENSKLVSPHVKKLIKFKSSKVPLIYFFYNF